MDFEELRAFLNAAELGGVSAAARALGLPKSRVSRLIASLESDLGARLLDRSTRGLAMTEDGRAFLDHARRILRNVEEARGVVSGGSVSGLLRLTAPPTFGARFLAPLLPDFLAKHPDLGMQVELTSRLVDLVEDGFDLALRIGEPVASSLVMRRLASNPVHLCASPNYIERTARPASPDDLNFHFLMLMARRGARVARLVLKKAGKRVELSATPRLVSNEPSILLEAALAGAGIAEVPILLGRPHLDSGALVEVLPGWTGPETVVYALFPPGRIMAPRVRAFLVFLEETLIPSLQPIGNRKRKPLQGD